MSDFKPLKTLVKEMVDCGLFQTRSKAVDAVRRGVVFINGEKAVKPAQKIPLDAVITVDDPAHGYVSRAAFKLKAALDVFCFDASDRVCLDIGASTGGFTEVLLETGARHIIAVDVGHGQFHPSLRDIQNVTLHEGLNIRDIIGDHVIPPKQNTPYIDAIVCDVSFISLRLALPAALRLAGPGTWAAILVKPQFEVGRDGIGKGGIVRNCALGLKAAEDIALWLGAQDGWAIEGLIQSPIKGSDGNQEYMLGAVFNG